MNADQMVPIFPLQIGGKWGCQVLLHRCIVHHIGRDQALLGNHVMDKELGEKECTLAG